MKQERNKKTPKYVCLIFAHISSENLESPFKVIIETEIQVLQMKRGVWILAFEKNAAKHDLVRLGKLVYYLP